MATITIPKELLEECFRNILNEYGVEDVGTFADIISKAEKYRWHDLRKNPNDLPKEKTDMHIVFLDGTQTLVTYRPNSNYKYSNILHSEETEGYVNYTNVIAWRELEPFEEVE